MSCPEKPDGATGSTLRKQVAPRLNNPSAFRSGGQHPISGQVVFLGTGTRVPVKMALASHLLFLYDLRTFYLGGSQEGFERPIESEE